MNAIAGLALPAGARDTRTAATRWLAGQNPLDLPRTSPSGDEIVVAAARDGGQMLGVAQGGGVTVALLGGVHLPFPEWGEGSPLDDANETADTLRRRYLERGSSFLDGLVGHFVAVVIDDRSRRLLLGRSPRGSVHFFVSQASGGLLFSSRLSDFGDLLGEDLVLDRSVEDFLLGYEFLPHGRTLFRDVTVLPAGTILELHEGRLAEHSIAPPRPWGDEFADVDLEDEAQAIDALHAAFEQAVAEQAPSAPEIGVLLGGVDSALIAATLARRGKTVHTLSFQYPDESYNQRFVEELAREYGLEHHWVPMTPEILRDGLAEYALRFNQVVGQPHYVIATAEACRAARRIGLSHCFTGDGCDGLFLGYPTVHFRAKLIERLSPVAPLLGRSLALATHSSWAERRLGHPYRIARNVGAILRRPQPARGHIAACTLDRRALEQLRGDAPAQEWDAEHMLRELARGLDEVGLVRLAYMGKGRVGLNMTKLEGSAAWSGVTLNSPYLHPGMAALAGRLPDAFSRAAGDSRSRATGKYAFLKMIEKNRLLPEEIIYQRKQSPVTAPVDEWYWGLLRGFVVERFESLPFPVDRDYAASLVSPKLAERLFRDRVLSHYVSTAAGLLLTYASFADVARGASAPGEGRIRP